MNKKTIYIADDETLMREIYAHRFTMAGLRVETFIDGVQLIDRLIDALPDIILTDVNMPFLGGIELFDEINKRLVKSPGKTKVVAWTNYNIEHLVEPLKQRGVLGILKKVDFNGDDLVQKVLELTRSLGEVA